MAEKKSKRIKNPNPFPEPVQIKQRIKAGEEPKTEPKPSAKK